MKYRRKPVVVEAIQWDGHNEDEVYEFADGNAKVVRTGMLQVMTHSGTKMLYPGDYVVRDAHGDIYTYEWGLFEKDYEPLADHQSTQEKNNEVP